MKERKVIFKCDKYFYKYEALKFELFIFDDNTFAILSSSDKSRWRESCWLEGTKEELTIKFIEDIVDDEDYSYYFLLDKFPVDFYDGIYITNWLNKHE